MNFHDWLMLLSYDAARLGCRNRFQTATLSTWFHIWQEGATPSVIGILDWARSDPERFRDLRETESAVGYEMVA